MSHDLDDDLMVPPDRRPLVYGSAAIIILLVAAFLFWPQGSEDDPLQGRNFVPETTTQASDESIPTGGESLADMASGTDVAAIVDDATSAPTGTAGNPAAETTIIEDETPARTTPRETQVESTPKRETTTERTPTRPSAPTPATPTSVPTLQERGEWVLNVGSFSSRENANNRYRALKNAGIESHILEGSQADGSSIFRVRIGYFGSSTEAKAYGSWLKSSQKIDGWAGRN